MISCWISKNFHSDQEKYCPNPVRNNCLLVRSVECEVKWLENFREFWSCQQGLSHETVYCIGCPRFILVKTRVFEHSFVRTDVTILMNVQNKVRWEGSPGLVCPNALQSFHQSLWLLYDSTRGFVNCTLVSLRSYRGFSRRLDTLINSFRSTQAEQPLLNITLELQP